MKSQLSVVSCQLSVKRIIRHGVMFLTLLFAFHSSLFTLADAGTVNDKVDALQKQLASITDITGSFSQSSYIKDIEETQKYSGTFLIKKPAFMMWEYAAPRDEKVVIRDNDTWIYKKSQNQVIKTTFSKKSYSQVPIALLLSMEKIRDDFEITMPEKNALQLVPKREIGFIKTLLIETASGNFPIKMFTIFDTYGNIIMIELSNIKTNTGLEDALFKFTVPEGAEVFDMNQ